METFFFKNKQTLVAIDVYEVWRGISKKKAGLKEMCRDLERKINESVVGVVLAPLADSVKSVKSEDNTKVLCAEEACELLGG